MFSFFKCNTPDNIDQIFSVLCYISHTKQTKITIILKYKIYETMWMTFLNESVLHTLWKLDQDPINTNLSNEFVDIFQDGNICKSQLLTNRLIWRWWLQSLISFQVTADGAPTNSTSWTRSNMTEEFLVTPTAPRKLDIKQAKVDYQLGCNSKVAKTSCSLLGAAQIQANFKIWRIQAKCFSSCSFSSLQCNLCHNRQMRWK